jgi:hypothetical protein
MFIKQFSFKKLIIWFVFNISYYYETLWYKKVSDNPKKNDIEAWLNQLVNIHILRRNLISKWEDFKTTHELDGCTQNLHMCIH